MTVGMWRGGIGGHGYVQINVLFFPFWIGWNVVRMALAAACGWTFWPCH